MYTLHYAFTHKHSCIKILVSKHKEQQRLKRTKYGEWDFQTFKDENSDIEMFEERRGCDIIGQTGPIFYHQRT